VFSLDITSHHGYKCLDPLTGRLYLARHVVFNEHVFPFQTPHSITSPPNLPGFLPFPDSRMSFTDPLPNTSMSSNFPMSPNTSRPSLQILHPYLLQIQILHPISMPPPNTSHSNPLPYLSLQHVTHNSPHKSTWQHHPFLNQTTFSYVTHSTSPNTFHISPTLFTSLYCQTCPTQ
jgi:hypothetical protein